MKAPTLNAEIDLNDEALALAATRGDERAFHALYERHRRDVLAFVTKVVGVESDREDVTQEVFLQLHRALPNFRGDCCRAAGMAKREYPPGMALVPEEQPLELTPFTDSLRNEIQAMGRGCRHFAATTPGVELPVVQTREYRYSNSAPILIEEPVWFDSHAITSAWQAHCTAPAGSRCEDLDIDVACCS
jgi:hypothetical protein